MLGEFRHDLARAQATTPSTEGLPPNPPSRLHESRVAFDGSRHAGAANALTYIRITLRSQDSKVNLGDGCAGNRLPVKRVNISPKGFASERSMVAKHRAQMAGPHGPAAVARFVGDIDRHQNRAAWTVPDQTSRIGPQVLQA